MDKDPAQAAANLSQVTVDPKQDKLITIGIVMTIIVVVVVMGLASHLFKHHPKSPTPNTQITEDSTQTLEENLAHLRALLVAEKAKHPELMRQSSLANTGIMADSELSKPLLARMNASTTFFSSDARNTSNPTNTTSAKVAVNNASDAHGLVGADANSNFVNSPSSIDQVEATKLLHPEYIVPAGEVIPAVLESAISSDLPGMVRAVVSRDVYSLQGERRLIPKGATLIGQYSAGIVAGQSRILAVWERLQLPKGIVIAISSPSTDTLGRTGQSADLIDNHFMEKFATSALLSVMGVYTANAGVSNQTQYNSASAYRSSVADSFQTASQQALMQNMMIKPTLDVHQGALINVFVAHDLSFYQVMHGVHHG